MRTDEAPIRVLFITGFGRSGTTILDSILGQVEGHFSAGELHYLWDRGLRDDRLCACGEPFSRCPVWPQVMRAAFPSRPPEVDAMVAVRESLTPRRALVRSWRHGSASPEERDYMVHLGRLYAAIASTTGARVVVDSSKSPGHGELLRRVPGIEPYIVHLVRDARAVAWSWQKRKIYDDSGDEPMFMTRHPPARSARHWLVWNLAAELLFQRLQHYRRVRYEDFMARPRPTVRRLVEWVGGSGTGLPFASDHSVRLAPTHAVAGNPSRFERGSVELRIDDEWTRRMPAGQRRLVSLLTWPLLWRYGYLKWRVAGGG